MLIQAVPLRDVPKPSVAVEDEASQGEMLSERFIAIGPHMIRIYGYIGSSPAAETRPESDSEVA